MRRVSKPENFTTAKEAADFLRSIATNIEKQEYPLGRTEMFAVAVTIRCATQEEVDYSLLKDAQKRSSASMVGCSNPFGGSNDEIAQQDRAPDS